MFDRTNKTLICSVVFLDIVEYSIRPVSEQMHLKQRFNSIVAAALEDIAESDRIILDTGDGAAISFIGDPEDALFVAMSLRDSLNEDTRGLSSLDVRIGINLGPAKLVKDINDKLNLIGDGINVAQRIMSFAEPGTVLVSRSYYEVVSCLSEEYAQLFHHEGSRTDKHVRDHEVYGVGFISQELMKKKRTPPQAKPRLWRSNKRRGATKPIRKSAMIALPLLAGIGISGAAWFLGRQSMVEPVLVIPATATPATDPAKPAPPPAQPAAAPAPAMASTSPADTATPPPVVAVEATPPIKENNKAAPKPAASPAPHDAAGEPDKPATDRKPAPDKKPMPDKKAAQDKKPQSAKDKPATPAAEARPATPAPEAEKPSRAPRDK